MRGFKRTVTIDRPIETVFDFMTNADHVGLYLPGVTKIEFLTEGGFKTGAKFRETRTVNGKSRSAVIEVVEHRRPDEHAARSAMLGLRVTYWFRFFREGHGTRVDLDAEVRGNVLWWLFLGAISRMMEKEDGELLNRLKTAVEQSTGNKSGGTGSV